MAEKIDVVIFGATGFTGKHTIPYVAKFCKKNQLSWGIAGRTEAKLTAVLEEYQTQIEQKIDTVPKIIADVSNENSIIEMARKSKVIINCCGPFRFYGEIVVKACAEEGTHHIDVSGEMQYIEEMVLKYNSKAQETGALIIGACGMESIPVDLGLNFLEQNFDGTLNSVAAYLQLSHKGNSGSGTIVNYGTWESAIYVLSHANELKDIRKQLWPQKLPEFKPKLETNYLPHKVENNWGFPFHATDRSVVKRSQRLFYEKNSKRPIQIETYLLMPSFLYILLTMIGLGVVVLLTKFSLGVKFLLKFPGLSTLGMISHENPSEEKVQNTKFTFTLIGEGWKEKLSNPDDQYSTKPDSTIVAKIKGTNPGYGATCLCLTLAAITILKEKNKMPNGGVYPPGYAFAKTSLLQKLNENGLTFEIEK